LNGNPTQDFDSLSSPVGLRKSKQKEAETQTGIERGKWPFEDEGQWTASKLPTRIWSETIIQRPQDADFGIASPKVAKQTRDAG